MSSIDSLGASNIANSIVNATATSKTNETQKSSSKYGNTIGNPELSDTAAEYYNSLKEKYSDLEFVLVDDDSVDTAEQQAAKYMNSGKTVVLLNASKIESMASDESVRTKYESLIEDGVKQLEEMGNSLETAGANVKGYGIRINDDGTSTLFAVVDKSLSSQKERIEKLQEKHRAEKADKAEKTDKAEKADKAEKTDKAEKAEKHQKADKVKTSDDDVDAIDIINASSMEELVSKLAEYIQNNRMNEIQTQEETYVGQSIDFKL